MQPNKSAQVHTNVNTSYNQSAFAHSKHSFFFYFDAKENS